MWSLSSMRFGCYGTDGSANQELTFSDDFDQNQHRTAVYMMLLGQFGANHGNDSISWASQHQRIRLEPLGHARSAVRALHGGGAVRAAPPGPRLDQCLVRRAN